MEQRFSDLEPPPGPLKWYVPTKGYRWVTAESEGPFAGANRPEWEERRLCQPAGRSRDVTPYEPLEEPALFQRFAALPMTEEAVLAFANRYGWLGIAEPFSVNAKEPGAIRVLGGKKTQSVIWGERLGAWRTEAAVLQGVLELRDSPEKLPGLQREVNRKLAELTVGRLFHLPRRGEDQDDPSPESLTLRVMPRNLLGAIWTQFAEELAGYRRSEKCRNCPEWFEVKLGGIGKTERKEFCTDACRMQAYRRRKASARKLRAEGMTLREIAKRLSSHLKTVRGWVLVQRPRGRSPSARSGSLRPRGSGAG